MAIITIHERGVKVMDVLNIKCPQNVYMYIELGNKTVEANKQDNAKQVKTKQFKASKITHFYSKTKQIKSR